MKKIFLIILLLAYSVSYCQKKNEIKQQFAFFFLQENILEIKDIVTGKNSYDIENISIDVDTLNSYNTDILFFKFEIGKNKLKFNEEKFEVYFNSSSCTEYIVAYNVRNNNSYRIKGFSGNDFLFLIRDINKLSDPPKNLKQLISDLNSLNIGVNFKEIYKALIKQNFDAECLLQCSEPKPVHGKIR